MRGEPSPYQGTSPRQRAGLAGTCCAVMFLYAVYFGSLGVLLPAIGRTFGLGPEVEGRLFPASFAGFISGVLLCGTLSDHLGRKAALLLGIGLYGAGLAAVGVASSFGVVLLASVLVGAGSGAMETVASALAADLYPERRAFVLNAVQAAFGAGAALTPVLVHSLLAAQVSWRPFYFAYALANAFLFLALALQRVPRSAHGPEALDLATLWGVLRQPAFLALCVSQALYVGGEMGFFVWMPSYFEQRVPGGAAWAGLVVSVFWTAVMVGRIATGGLVDRLPLARLVLLLAAGGAVGSALTLVWTHPLVVMLFVAATGLCFSGIFGLVMAEAAERFPTLAGTVFGAVVASGGLGGSLVPWAVGALAATPLDWRGALLLVPTAMLLLIRVTVWLERRG